VGSSYTGNFGVASRWQGENDPEGRFTVIDTGAASGRLGAIAIATARFSEKSESPDAVIDFARRAVEQCREYIFIDNLKFLAAGGRISKTKAFFGTMLNMKPIVTPTSEGVIRAGVAKNFDDQLAFALARLADEAGPKPFIMIQYTDNRNLVEERVMPEIASRYPGADIQLRPLSLTTGVHVGPGTWSLAFLPEI
jgi:DegV family protein with EDD domain